MVSKQTFTNRHFFANYWPSGALNSTSLETPQVSWDSGEVFKGSSVPGYKQKIRAGVQAGTTLTGFTRQATAFENRFVMHRTTVSNTGDYRRVYETRAIPYEFLLTDSLQFPNYLGNLSEDKANAEALSRLVQSIRGKQTAFQGGVALGELGQTLKMLRNPAVALRQGLDGYFTALQKVRRIPNRTTRRRALSETWLEYSFGWVPFINDIQDAKRLIQEKHDVDARSRIYAEGNSQTATSGFIGQYSWGGMPWNLEGDTVSSVNVKYYGTCASWRANKYSAQSLGLDLTNFAPTAWELVPWSFLVDYFTNIGEIISGASLSTAGVRWIMKGVEKTVERRCNRVLNVFNSAFWIKESDTTTQYPTGSLRSVSRQPYTGSLVPNLRFEIPGMGLKWLNLAALARTHNSLRPFY